MSGPKPNGHVWLHCLRLEILTPISATPYRSSPFMGSGPLYFTSFSPFDSKQPAVSSGRAIVTGPVAPALPPGLRARSRAKPLLPATIFDSQGCWARGVCFFMPMTAAAGWDNPAFLLALAFFLQCCLSGSLEEQQQQHDEQKAVRARSVPWGSRPPLLP